MVFNLPQIDFTIAGASYKEKSPTRFKIFGIYRDFYRFLKIYNYEDLSRFLESYERFMEIFRIFRDL